MKFFKISIILILCLISCNDTNTNINVNTDSIISNIGTDTNNKFNLNANDSLANEPVFSFNYYYYSRILLSQKNVKQKYEKAIINNFLIKDIKNKCRKLDNLKKKINKKKYEIYSNNQLFYIYVWHISNCKSVLHIIYNNDNIPEKFNYKIYYFNNKRIFMKYVANDCIRNENCEFYYNNGFLVKFIDNINRQSYYKGNAEFDKWAIHMSYNNYDLRHLDDKIIFNK